MKFYLIVAKGSRRGLPIPIEIDLFMIGGHKTCQLRKQHPDIGEQQCAIVTRGKKVFIRDLGSGSATLVNGEVMPPSEEWPLHAGDKIGVGPLEFLISYREQQAAQRDMEAWALKQLDADTGPKKSALEELKSLTTDDYDHDDASSVAGSMISQLSAKKGVVRGRLRILHEDGVTVVMINDMQLVDDAELAHLKKELHDNLNFPNLKVLLDFKVVRRMSTAAAEMLAGMADWLARTGGTIAMCRMSTDINRMMLGMQSVYNFRIFGDKAQALAAIGRKPKDD